MRDGASWTCNVIAARNEAIVCYVAFAMFNSDRRWQVNQCCGMTDVFSTVLAIKPYK